MRKPSKRESTASYALKGALLAIAAIVSSSAPIFGQASQPKGAELEVGRAAPDFTLKTLTGDRVHLTDLRGHPVLVNFWASWCKPCAAEMPYIVAAYDSLKERGLLVLAVNLTDQERLKDARGFVEQFQLPFAILLDEKGRVREGYRLTAVPTSVFVDSTGVVREVVSGPMTVERLGHGLERILGPP